MNDKQVKALLKQAKPGRFAVGDGLYFRVTSEGAGFWVLRYSIHGKRREITLDRYPQLSLADARAKAAALKYELKNDVDPLAERKRSQAVKIRTVDQLADDWLIDCEKRLKYPQIPRRIYKKDLAPSIGDISLKRITPIDVRDVITKIAKSGRSATANDALMYCKQLFRHGIKLNLISQNPAAPFNTNDAGGVEVSRDRALSIDELSILFDTLRQHHDQFARENYLAVALLVVLGVRKTELIAAEWQEFEMAEGLWHLPEKRSKMGVPITVPLPKAAMAWLNELRIRGYGSEFVFPKRRSSKRFGHISLDTLNAAIQKLFTDKKLEIQHFTVHDLRRTCRSLLSKVGVPGHVAERCLNHKLKGVEGIYDRYDYLDERREALQKIAEVVSPLVDPDTETNANVVSIGRGTRA